MSLAIVGPYAAPVSETVVQVLRVAAYGVVHDSAGRLLLARLTDRTAHPGWWTLPGGGIEHGEHPEDAVVREVREETGLRVGVRDLLGVDSVRRRHADDTREEDFHAIRIVYRAVVHDEIAPLVHESDGSTDLARWVDPVELGRLPLVDLAHLGIRLAAR